MLSTSIIVSDLSRAIFAIQALFIANYDVLKILFDIPIKATSELTYPDASGASNRFNFKQAPD
ncbi:hypothetical protein FD47_GL000756 [Lentilactobacillus parafarraginis DSM 18390 = JCM 14109]|uniref:Uncharacterized protein n=1 Tax=Lentilactobacillus parafarraginis DSM 18390 = JCM 14109 TaxID=1423786 RepID=A0A0R1YNY6_9LACO|nr:hypothetical protein FD47_GL000756 [Lentilactobacillus parafarraginis DSM 18390 = JCM 14109]